MNSEFRSKVGDALVRSLKGTRTRLRDLVTDPPLIKPPPNL
ncbi:hypothetical protein [Nostoc sp. PCC 9305]